MLECELPAALDVLVLEGLVGVIVGCAKHGNVWHEVRSRTDTYGVVLEHHAHAAEVVPG